MYVFICKPNKKQPKQWDRALLKVKQGVAKAGSCVNFTPPGGAKSQMTADILYAVSDSDSDT